MDMSSIAGAATLMYSSQTQQALSATMMKQAVQQQNQVAELLAQMVGTARQPVADASYGFSTYA